MTLASSNPPLPALSSRQRLPDRRRRHKRAFEPQQIRAAMQWQPRYQPADAAEFCGISEDRVTDSILARPKLFPERTTYARRHDWNDDEFVRVVLSVCSLCPKAARFVADKLSQLSGM